MRRFALLFEALDTTTSTLAKVEAMVGYFRDASPEDSAWAAFFLTGRRFKRLVPTAVLREAIHRESQISPWLFEECYATVGDLAETIALLLPTSHQASSPLSLSAWVTDRVLTLRDQSAEAQCESIQTWWKELSSREIFLINKLLTGGFRAGVSQNLVVRALSKHFNLSEASLTHRLMGEWQPTPEFFLSLSETKPLEKNSALPYPFYLASPLEGGTAPLGEPSDWLIEWKWDGIRAQGIHRQGSVYLWSRGEELITDRFPEISNGLPHLPSGTVLDGEILAFSQGQVLPFSALQQRIGRKTVSAKLLDSVPVVFMIFDLLESEGQDLRELPLLQRRRLLQALLSQKHFSSFQISPQLLATSWNDFAKLREEARDQRVEGLMIKRLQSPYRVGRKRGDWWKWKVDPHTMDAVLLYAQPGHGRRATLYTDYTFGIWQGKQLVPIAKAYSGLTDEEILEMDKWIRKHTTEKFGPVRKVAPQLVFELAFEAVQESPRHKSGLAVRFPRILRKRDDKKALEADTVERVRALLYAA